MLGAGDFLGKFRSAPAILRLVMWGCRSPGGHSRPARRVCLSQSRLEWVSAGPAAHAVSRSRRVEPHRLRFYTIALQSAGSSGPTGWQATAPTVPDASRDSNSHIVAVLPMSAGGSACGTLSCGCPAVDNDSHQRGVEVSAAVFDVVVPG